MSRDRDVAMVSASDGWAFGDNGRILRWDGAHWSDVPSPASGQLTRISMLSPDDGWAAGADILHWDGMRWTRVTSPSTLGLRNGVAAIDMVSNDAGWILGNAGELRRWNGVAWLDVDNPGIPMPSDLSMAAADDGWIVGYRGDVFHWNGSAWRRVAAQTSSGMYSVSALPGGIAWISGYCNAVWRVEGDEARWISMDRTYPNCVGTVVDPIEMLSDDCGWAVRKDPYTYRDQILQWDGVKWTWQYDGGCCGGTLNALDPDNALTERLCRWNGRYWESSTDR